MCNIRGIKSKMPSKNFKTLRLSDGILTFYIQTIPDTTEPQLIIRPKLVGICRSDIKEFLGTRTVRHDFGHEILAEVVANNHSKLPKVGSLVVLDPHVKITRTSGFGELVVASAGVNNLLKAFIEVPVSVDEDRLIFIEPLSCAHHCVANLMRFAQRDDLKDLTVGVIGAGMTGALTGLLCQHYGADVTLINRNQERLDFLKSTTLYTQDKLLRADKVDQEFDVVIPTTTFLFPTVLKLSERIVKDKGLILLYGGTKVGDAFPDLEKTNIDQIRRSQSSQQIQTTKSFKLCGTHGAVTQDFKKVAQLLSDPSVNLPVKKLITDRIKLEDVPLTIIGMTKKETFGKIVVTM